MKILLFFLILAIAVGGGAAMWMSQSKPKPQVGQPVVVSQPVVVQPKVIQKEVPTMEVVVARDDIPVGARIKIEMLDKRPYPQSMIPQGDANILIPGDRMERDVIGRVARGNFVKGMPILSTMLANPGDPSFLAASLKKGMRAVTIQIDGISGVAGFVYPGDLVDVIITQDITLPGGELDSTGRMVKPEPQKVSEILIPGVRVMAIDQRYQGRAGESPMPGSSATLELAAIDVQKVRLGEARGRLSLSLKALPEENNKDGKNMVRDVLPRPVGVGDLSRITPPSIFPAIYEGGDRVMPRTLQLSEALDENADKSDAKPVEDTEAQKKLKELENMRELLEKKKPSASIAVVRGTKREVTSSGEGGGK